jgi:hypothetical protein
LAQVVINGVVTLVFVSPVAPVNEVAVEMRRQQVGGGAVLPTSEHTGMLVHLVLNDLVDGAVLQRTVVAALCINSDLSAWLSVQRVAEMMLGESKQPRPTTDIAASRLVEFTARGEAFVHDVDELAAHLIHQAVINSGVPVELMQKRHKIEIVRDLKSRGMFLLRDAVDMIANSLQVTRFTIYNYLNEISDEEMPSEIPAVKKKSKSREST